MVFSRWKHISEAFTKGLNTFGDLPQTDPTMDRKHFLLNTGTNDLQAPNDLMNTKTRWAFIDSEHTIQLMHSMINTTSGWVAILGDELDSSQRVLLGDTSTLLSCVISIGDKEDATQGNQRIIEEPSTEDLLAIGSTTAYVSPTLLGMANEGADPQIIVAPKIFPLELGESIPLGHNLKDPLPECTSYPPGFVAWAKTYQWAYTKNNKKPITGRDGGIFNNSNWERTLTETLSPGGTVISHVKGADKESYILIVQPILQTSQAYKSSFTSSEMSVVQKMDEWNFQNPPTVPQGHPSQPGQQGQQGLDATAITSIGTAIATSMATAMTKSSEKKGFVKEKATTMLNLLGSYSSINDEGVEVLVLGEFTDEFEQILNTKNKHEAVVAYQAHHTATAINLTSSSDISLVSMYMDSNPETYNSVRIEMMKQFNFINDSLNNVPLTYDTLITVFNYLRVNAATNHCFKKMCRSERVAKQDSEFEDDVQKRAPATKNLFVEGEQRTLKDFTALIANICLEHHDIFKYPEDGIIYKMLNTFLSYLHSAKGRQWMNTEINDNKYYLHSMMIVLQTTLVSMTYILCRDNALITRVNNGEVISNPKSIISAKQVSQMFNTNMKIESNMPAASYKGKPKSYDYFKLGTEPTSRKIPEEESDFDTPPKRRKTESKTEANTTTTTTTRDRAVSFAETEREKGEKGGFLIYTGPKGRTAPKYTVLIDGKRICGGYVYIGKWCSKGSACPCHHPNSAEQVPSIGRQDFIKWVNDTSVKNKWAQGKKPKRSE